MIFKDLLPSPALASMVDHYRLRHFRVPKNFDNLARPKVFVPKPEQCMTFYPRGYEITAMHNSEKIIIKPRAEISGQYSQGIDRSSGAEEFLMIQVVFRPGALHRLTGIPFGALHNNYFDLQDIYSSQVKSLSERLCNCEHYCEMIDLIETFILELKERQKIDFVPFDRVFEVLSKPTEKFCLKSLADRACLSSRQFERKIHDYLGISPQLFSRIARFSKTYEFKEKNPSSDWLSIACYFGYHDYQQLSKDYKAFTGETPNKIFQLQVGTLETILGLRQ